MTSLRALLFSIALVVTSFGAAHPFSSIMFPGPGLAPSKVTTLSFVDQGNANVANITIPATTQVGDLIVLFDSPSNSSGTPSTVVPAGFTVVDNGAFNLVRNIISYKVAAPGDSGSSITGMTGTGTSRKIIATYRGNVPISSVTVNGLTTQSVASAPTTQTVTSSSGPVPLVIFGSSRVSGTSQTLSGTLASGGTSLTSTSALQAVEYLIQNSSPSNVTWGQSGSGITSVVFQSFYFSVT